MHLPLSCQKDDSKDQIDRTYAREEKIFEFQDNACQEIAKIGKMCIETVQKEFLSIKSLSK